MVLRKAGRLAAFGLACALVGSAQNAWGQGAAAAPSRQELDPARRAQAAPRSRPADLFSRPGATPCPLAENPAPLTITSLTVRGLESVEANSLRKAYADVLNRPNGDAADLCVIRDRISDALFNQGVLARVEIPAQSIADGSVIIEVIEARIVNVSVRGDPGPAADAVERLADHLRGMRPFNLAKVQRYILLASDIPGYRVNASLRPSPSGERGAVDLDLSVQRDAHELILNAQNLQGKATGRWGALARADFNGYTALGERTSLIVYRTLENEQWVVQLVEEARLGGDGLMVRGSVAYGESRPGDVLKPLALRSTSLVANAELAYPLLRSRSQSVTLAAGLDLIDQRSRLKRAGKLLDDQLHYAYIELQGQRLQYLGATPVALEGRIGVRQGLDLGGSQEGDPLLSRAEADPQATIGYATASLIATLTERFTLVARLEGQYAHDPLASYSEYAVGSLSIGRGYDPAFVGGDSALAGSVELRAAPFQARPGVLVGPYAFWDLARVWNRDTGSEDQTLNSLGVGLRALFRNSVLDVLYAYPLDRRAPDGARPTPRILANLTARFW